MSSVITFLSTNIIPVLIGAGGLAVGIIGIRSTIKSNSELKKTQKAEAKAAESRKATSEKVVAIQQQKEKDLSEVPKDGKVRVKKANEKIKDFNSKL